MGDYEDRSYLSAVEAARFLDVSVSTVHRLTRAGTLSADIAASGQKRYRLDALTKHKRTRSKPRATSARIPPETILHAGNTTQTVYLADARKMDALADNSVHLMVTSPPYFNAKMYSHPRQKKDLGNVHDLDTWFEEITKVWAETFRVLQPGRRAFINIMNLPVRENGSFRALNLVGRTVDVCESLGFVFKRDIIWHKTNGVRAHFGSYPDPGGILINNMHESILEFQKPARKNVKVYAHLTTDQRAASKLDKDFWLQLKNSDVWTMAPEGSGDNRSHVAPFPVELPDRLIRGFSFVGETVLDPFCGSGTTLRAAADRARNGIGYDINKDFVAATLQRLQG